MQSPEENSPPLILTDGFFNDSWVTTIIISKTLIYHCTLFYSWQVFPTISNWWFFSGVWVTRSLLRSGTLLSNRADFSSAMVWMVLILPLIFCLSRFFSRFLENVPRAPDNDLAQSVGAVKYTDCISAEG